MQSDKFKNIGGEVVVYPALWAAALNGQVEEVGQLLAAGADIEERGGLDELTPLHTAAFSGHAGVVRRLLDKGADMSAEDTEGVTPLHFAAMEGRKAVVRLLLRKGADVSSNKEDGATPLHLAAFNGKEGVVRLLLSKGADVSAKTHTGFTAEEMAMDVEQPGVAAILRAEAARRADSSARGLQEPPPPKPQVAYIQHNPREFLLEVRLVAADRDGEKLQVKGQIPRNSSTGMHFQV